jgi:hypothetical protein
MLRRQLIGLALLVGGLAVGGLGWTLAENEIIGMFYGFIGLLTVLSGGMLMHSGTS